MPVSLYSSTGALQFRSMRLLSRPVLVDDDYSAPTSQPDETIDPPLRRAPVRAGFFAKFVARLERTKR